MPNDALKNNPPTATIDISVHASDWLWAAFAIQALSLVIFSLWNFSRPRNGRVFHYVAIAILFITSVAYFAMASDLGSTPILVEFTHEGTGTRAIWYARYIEWVLATPLLLLLVFLGGAVTLSETFALLFFNTAFFVSLLLGALTASSYKWGFFAFGLWSLFHLWFHKWGVGRTSSTGAGVGGAYTRGATWITFLYFLIPLAWGLSEGGNRISSTGEQIFYGIIDIFLFPVFLFTHIFMLGDAAYGPYAAGTTTGTSKV